MQAVVSIDVEPNLSQIGTQLDAQARRLKPLGVNIELQGDGLAQVGGMVRQAQGRLDTLSTSRAVSELKVLGATADRELAKVQRAKSPFGSGTAAVGWSSSKASTTVVGSTSSLSPISSSIEVSGVDKLAPAASRTARAVDDITTSSTRAHGGLTRLGGTVSDVGTKLSTGSRELGRFTSDLGLLAGGFGVAEIAGAGVTALIDSQAEATSKYADEASRLGELQGLQGLFDPTNLERYSAGAKEIAGVLGEITRVKPQGILDKIGDAVGLYDARIFGDSQQQGNQAEAAAALTDKLKASLEGLGEVAGRQLLDSVKAQMIALGVSAKETDRILAPLYKQISDTAAAKRGAEALDALGTSVERLGVKIDPTASKWENFAKVLGGIFDPIEKAMSAEEALSDGQATLASAQKKYADIVNGNTAGLKSATEALTEAREGLAKAVAETGPGSRAARDAAQEVRDALRAYRDLEIEAGKKKKGDFFDSRTEDLLAARQRITDAQEKLNEIEAGNSDAVVSARDRLADAQQRYNEELSKTGPNSEEARAALEAVSDAEEALVPLIVNVEQAQAELNAEAEKHPEAIQASIDKVKQWIEEGKIAADVGARWLAQLEGALERAKQIRDTLPGQPGVYTNDQWANYGGGAARAGVPNNPAPSKPSPKAPRTMTASEGERIGLYTYEGPVGAIKNGDRRTDSDGRSWRWDAKSRQWVAQFAGGGIVPGFTLGDTVPAMLTPGEGVVNRAGMAQLGPDNLHALNRGTPMADASADEIRGLRGDIMGLTSFLMRQATVSGGSETLAPILVEQTDVLRRIASGTERSAANVRAGALEFA